MNVFTEAGPTPPTVAPQQYIVLILMNGIKTLRFRVNFGETFLSRFEWAIRVSRLMFPSSGWNVNQFRILAQWQSHSLFTKRSHIRFLTLQLDFF